MKQQADQHHNERSFDVGYWVFYSYNHKKNSLKQDMNDNKL